MGKNNKRVAKGAQQTNQAVSNKGSQPFFNQKPKTQPLKKPKARQPKEQQAPKITLETTTDILLAGILEELKTQNMLKLMKLKKQQLEEEKESTATEEAHAQDDAHFKDIRNTMYL